MQISKTKLILNSLLIDIESVSDEELLDDNEDEEEKCNDSDFSEDTPFRVCILAFFIKVWIWKSKLCRWFFIWVSIIKFLFEVRLSTFDGLRKFAEWVLTIHKCLYFY